MVGGYPEIQHHKVLFQALCFYWVTLRNQFNQSVFIFFSATKDKSFPVFDVQRINA